MRAEPDARGKDARHPSAWLALALSVPCFLLACGYVDLQRGGRVAAWLLDGGSAGAPKAWRHGVRTPEGAGRAASGLGGLEVDVVHEPASGRWLVRHPPGPASDHDLPALLGAIAVKSATVWLDLRNLAEIDPESSAERLATVVVTAGLEVGDVIVESPEVERLAAFASRGFRIAFYLPLEPGHLDKHGEQATAATMRALAVRAAAHRPDYVSSSLSNQALLRQWFPDFDRLHWWSDPGATSGLLVAVGDLFDARADPRVRGVLLMSGSP